MGDDLVRRDRPLREHIAINGVHLRGGKLAHVVDGINQALVSAPDDEPLDREHTRCDAIRRELDDLSVRDRRIGNLRGANRAFCNERLRDRAECDLRSVNGRIIDLCVCDGL